MTAQKTNVLLLSAGRRVELLQAFRREMAAKLPLATLYAGDLRPSLSAACQAADVAIELPKATAPDYAERILHLCLKHEIGLVVPTIDTELLPLAKAKPDFEAAGINLIISNLELVDRCRDKRKTATLFHEIGIATPKIFDRHQLAFPCFAKPFDGSRSIGAKKLSAPNDLTESMINDQKMIFMEFIDSSHDEYTIDAYFSKNSKLRCLVPRHRIEVRDGEINKGVTRKNHVYQYLCERLAFIPGARGCLTIQIFASPGANRYAALEINPRFGGGFPLSYASGANYPGWLIDEYLLEKDVPFFEGWEANLLMLRYDAQVLVRNHG